MNTELFPWGATTAAKSFPSSTLYNLTFAINIKRRESRSKASTAAHTVTYSSPSTIISEYILTKLTRLCWNPWNVKSARMSTTTIPCFKNMFVKVTQRLLDHFPAAYAALAFTSKKSWMFTLPNFTSKILTRTVTGATRNLNGHGACCSTLFLST